ncbi:hypothetical protein [Geoglobus ahangari]
MNIEIIGFISDRDFLKELNVKTIDFVFYSNTREANREVIKMLNRVSSYCYAYPHHSKLYFIGREDKLIEEIEKLGSNVVKNYSKDPEDVILRPLENSSHFTIARMLLYVGLKQNYRRNVFRVPLNKRKGEFFSRRDYGQLDPAVPNVYYYYGLKMKLDHSHEGHCILWMDMTLGAWQEIEGKMVGPLSYPRIKKLGVLSNFKEYSQPRPRERYDKTIEIIKNIFDSDEAFEVDMKTIGKIKFEKLRFT